MNFTLANLDLLPTELQIQILKKIPNMKVLRNLLCASSQYFYVYKSFRKSILSHIAWNQITPTILQIALNALEQRDNSKFRSNETGLFKTQKKIREPHEISFETWERLIHFHEIVESFISNFTSNRLLVLENSIDPKTQSTLLNESPDRKYSLSQLEYTRLARAFYNLELYGHLFHDLDTSKLTLNQHSFSIRGTNFLENLQDWELEELLCVRSYMIERLKDFLNKFEDNFIEVFQKNMLYINWSLQDTPGSTSLTRLLSCQGHMWLQAPWIESCLTRGLETLSTMLSTDTLQVKFQIFGEIDNPGKYMTKALNRIPPCSIRELAAKMKSPEIGFYDNIEQPNEAWFWAMKFRGHRGICSPRDIRKIWAIDGSDIHDLECWGYVIWDHERLNRLGILSKR